MQEPTFSVSTFPSISQDALYANATPSPTPSSSSSTTPTGSSSPLPPVTCAATSSKFVLLGLANGTLSLYDVFGNLLDSHTGLHAGPVTAVALSGDSVIASASAAGDVRVARLSNTNHALLTGAAVAFTKATNSPALALAIDPGFGRPRNGERIALADGLGRVILHTAGWFGGSDVVIASDARLLPARSIAWVAQLIAFPTAHGVQVYDAKAAKVVCRLTAPGASQPASPMLASVRASDLESQLPPLDNNSEKQKQSNNDDDKKINSTKKNNGKWNTYTKIYMDVDESMPTSSQGEPTVRLFITWSNGARIVRISPQPAPTSTAAFPPREIEVVFRLDRQALPTPTIDDALIDMSSTAASRLSNMYHSPDDSPLLSVVPFGASECVALIGLPKLGGAAIHLVDGEGRAVKHMILPYHGICNASVLTIPDGDPLVLAIAYPDDRDEDLPEQQPSQKTEKQNTSSSYGTISQLQQKAPNLSSTSSSLSNKGGAPPNNLKGNEASSANFNSQILYIRSLTTAERVKWLLSEDRFLDALSIAQSAPGGSLRRAEVSLIDVGEQFLDSLREVGDYQRLVSVLQETISTTSPFSGFRSRDKVMMKRRKRWYKWIEVFKNSGHLSMVANVVPTYEPLLEQKTYTDILTQLANTNPLVMVSVLKTWPADVFDVSTVTKAIEKQLLINIEDAEMEDNDEVVVGKEEARTETESKNEGGTGGQGKSRAKEEEESKNSSISNSRKHKKWDEKEKEALNEGLLMLYALSGRHDETLLFLLRDRSKRVFEYIRSHHLYEAVRSKDTISGLYMIDATEATDILSHAPETVLSADVIVPILNKINNSRWLFMYLHAMFRIDSDQAPKYHNTLLKLYVNYGSPGSLYNFLKTSTHYSLDVALDVMGGPGGKHHGYLAMERVYVLSAMGDLNSSMDILLNELQDTFAAIEFATDYSDPNLWERLIQHAKTNASTLAALLDSPAGGKVDPVRLIPLLTSEMKIPNLRDRLHRILVDAALERALREDAAAALHHDAEHLLHQLDSNIYGVPSSST